MRSCPRTNPEKALQAYSIVLPILSIVESGIPCTLPATGTGKPDFSSFTRFRELWLWVVERLLRRSIVLASRTCVLNPIQGRNEDRLLWTLFSHYRTCSIIGQQISTQNNDRQWQCASSSPGPTGAYPQLKFPRSLHIGLRQTISCVA